MIAFICDTVSFFMGGKMRIGIPQSLLFHRYEQFIRRFFDRLEVEVIYSGPSNRQILERGIKSCVDEACLPIKIFHGHVSKLREECDKVAVFRLMKCEYGESICPKFAGLPELVKSGSGKDDLAFTSPLYLNDRKRFKRSLIRDGRLLGLSSGNVSKAFDETYSHIFTSDYEGTELLQGNSITVALLGHPYNTKDPFVNLNIIQKLRHMDIDVIMGEKVSRFQKLKHQEGLMKKPYWLFLSDNYGTAGQLALEGKTDGIIYLSSFCCGTDSITIEMIRNKIGNLPMLVLKLDEHTGEAGFNTRIEAFAELLERRKRHEGYFSDIGRQPYIRQVTIPRNRYGIDNPSS